MTSEFRTTQVRPLNHRANERNTRLDYEWATTLLAFLSILMIPIIWLWFYYGERLRLKSPWAREHFAQDEDSPH